MLAEFRSFIARGNVLDLAVAVIIGTAFATITKSLTNDIIMPVVGLLVGGFDFANYFIVLGNIPADFRGSPDSYADLTTAGVAVLGWGQFLTVVINFLILAFIIFMIVKQAGKIVPKHNVAAADPEDVVLLREIRDLLKK